MKRPQPKALVSALSAALFALSASPWALAQEQAPAEETEEAQAAEQEKAEELDVIVTTGTRIPRAGFDTLEPANVIGEDYVASRGLTNIADAINEIPGFGLGVTPEGGQASFGVAVNFVNRFGLGTARTLTLVNGRRFVSANVPTIFGPAAPGLQVDLNSIPSALVDRIENIAIGGAPAYGTDAIAGVVNVILKKDFEGLQIGTTVGQTDRGDNDRFNGSLIWGTNFAENRGNVTLAFSVDTSKGVLQTERERFRSSLAFQPNPLASVIAANQPNRLPGTDGRVNPLIPFNTGNTDRIPNSVLIRDSRFFTFTPGGLILPSTGAVNLADGRLRGFGPTSTTYFQFDRTGNLVPYNPGVNFGTSNAVGGDGWNIVETAQILSDLDRANFNTVGHFDLTDDVQLYWEGSYFASEGFELIDQSIFNVNLFTGASSPLVFPSNYAQLSSQAAQTLASLGQTSFRLSRASRDLVNNNAKGDNDTMRGVLGFTGEFDFLADTWRWDVSANYGRNEGVFTQNVLNQQNFVNSLHVVRDASGRLVCSPTPVAGVFIPTTTGANSTPVADPNCVPLDIFGEGRASAAARAYVTGRTRTETTLEQTVFNANVGGGLFEIYSGVIPINIGVEYREESGDFNPDAFQRAGLGRAVPIIPLSGEFDTKEAFAETVIPLVEPDTIPLLRQLDVTAKFRKVDNSVNGSFDAWTYGLQWRPFDDLLLRANTTRSFRAPAITELFTPTSSIFTTVPDPCDSRNVTGGTRPAVRQANCAAFFRQFNLNPANFQSTAVTATVQGTSSGDPNLENERGDSWTAGFVYTPEYIDGFRLMADYYEIEVSNSIANLSATAIATGCFDNTNFNTTDVTRANSFCERIERRADGQIASVRTGFVNGGILNFRGASAEAEYRRSLEDLGFSLPGSLSASVNAFRLMRLESSANNVVVNRDDGEIGNSHRQMQIALGYDHPSWGLNLQANYIGSAQFDRDFTVETRDILGIGSYWLVNAGAYMYLGESGLVRFSVTNVADRDAPFPTGGIATYDILGRRYAISTQWNF